MLGHQATLRPEREVAVAAVYLVVGLALTLFPWVAFGVLLLLAPWRSLRGMPLITLAAAAGLVVVSSSTGELDRVFAPILALSAVAVGAGRVATTTATTPRLSWLMTGALAGLALMAAASLVGAFAPQWLVLPWGFGGEPVVDGRVAGWLGHPNLWGVSVHPTTFLLVAWSLGLKRPMQALMVIVMGLMVGLASGSRAALLAFVVGTLWLVGERLARRTGRLRATMVLLATVAALGTALLVLSPDWRERALGLFGEGAPPTVAKNLFQSSEDLTDPVWRSSTVSVDREPQARGEPTVHLLSRSGGTWTDRLQQRVRLQPRTSYTLSVELQVRAEGSVEPEVGVIGWAEADGKASGLVLTLEPSGDLKGTTAGAVTLDSASAESVEGWWRIVASFQHDAASALALELGVAPRVTDGAAAAEAVVAVRALQLELGPRATEYVGTMPPDRRRLQAASAVGSRRALYGYLAERISERPWLGWGANAYQAARSEEPANTALRPHHEHSLLLALLFRFGLLGLLAFALGMVGMMGTDVVSLAIVVAMMIANLFDLTYPAVTSSLAVALCVGLAQGLTRRWPRSVGFEATTSG